jgi:hypothetical protein
VVEHFLGKEEVDSSILFNGSRNFGVEVELNDEIFNPACPPKLPQRRWVQRLKECTADSDLD